MPPQPQQSGGDNSLAPIWIALAIIIAGAVIWYGAQQYIVAFVLKVKLLEINLISLFTNKLAPLAASIEATPPSSYGSVPFSTLVSISNQVGACLNYVWMGLLFLLGLYVYFGSPTVNLRKVYTMQRLAEQEVQDWPQISPVVKLDLVKVDIDTGPWAMANQPMQFAKKYSLIQEEKVIEQHGEILVQPYIRAVLKRGEAQRIFALQLGRYWTSYAALPIHSKAIFAILAARINGDRAGASQLIETISASARGDRMDYSGVDELIAKHANNKYVVRMARRHAFEHTVLASLLLLARDDGVLASADFLWLKPIDRLLWYTLNTVGRKTPFVEVAGIFSHWLAELRFGRRLKVPYVEPAVDGLELALSEILYKSETPED